MPGLPLDAPILTTSGWSANGDLRSGDLLIDPLDRVTSVHAFTDAQRCALFSVSVRDGSEATVAADQLWKVLIRNTNNIRVIRVLTTEDLKRQVERKGYQVLMPKLKPFQFSPGPVLPLDPYLLGILLAEGALSEETLSFACHADDSEIVARIEKLLPERHTIKSYGKNDVKRKITVGNYDGAQSSRNTRGRNLVLSAVHDLGLRGTRSDTKFIPEPYLRAAPDDRLELLRGILDGDGSIKSDGNIRFASASRAPTEGVRELVLSLGGRASIKVKTNRSYTYRGTRVPSKDEYWINGICGLETSPFYLDRKARFFKYSPKSDSYARRVTAVEFVGYGCVRTPQMHADSHFVAYDLPLAGSTSSAT